MKKLFIIYFLLLSFGFSQNRVNVKNLVQYGEKFFQEDDDTPYNGIVFDMSKKTGNKILQYKMSDGKKNGYYREWFSDGSKYIEGYFINNDSTDKWTNWYKNGQIQSEKSFKNGIRIGKWTNWYKNGQKKSEKVFKENKLNGLFNLWSKSGVLITNGSFKNDRKEGLWTNRNQNDGYTYKQVNYKFGNYHGLWTSYHSNGNKSEEGNYINDLQNGLWTEWNSYGIKKTEKIFNNGDLTKFSEFDENGLLKKGYYKSNEKYIIIHPVIADYNIKDSLTSSEEGGYGFKKIANNLGFESYDWDVKKDKNYFGDSKAKKGGVINYIHSRFPRTMRVLGQNSNFIINSKTISALCYEGLLSLHPTTLEFVPSLASHWNISDDKMTFKFRINPDARWWDGMPVTADDVIATWDLRMDEQILSPSEQFTYGKFERPIAESKYIVSVKAKTKNWRNFLYFSTMIIHPSHILKDIDGTAFIEKYAYSVIPGSGPYIIPSNSIKIDDSYIFKRRENYWAKDSPFSRYKYNFDTIRVATGNTNGEMLFEKFKEGDQDFFNVKRSKRWIEETDFNLVQKGWIKKQRIFSEKPAGTSGYYFNMREWPFNDKNVRYAFSYLYDREELNREIYFNEYGMMNSLYSGSVYENKNNSVFKYNPEKAIRLLKEAGYSKRNSDGWLVHDVTGNVLSFEIIIPKTNAYMVTPFQQKLKEYGVDMQIKLMNFSTMIKNVNARNFNICLLAYSGLLFPNPEASLLSKLADQNGSNNIWGFKSRRVDELLNEYDICFDQERRIEILQEVDGIFCDVHPIAFSFARNYSRMMWWDKFDYPDWMLSRHAGEFWDVFYYWWYSDEKNKELIQSINSDKSLPKKQMDMEYWTKFN